jgi:hypothetical protein
MSIEQKVKEYIDNWNLGELSERELIDFINSSESDLFTGKDVEDNDISIIINKGVNIEYRTYQSNGWIRINRYELAEDDEGNTIIVESESYDK